MKTVDRGDRLMEKALLIYNPVAGDHGIPAKLDLLVQRFQDRGMILHPYRLTHFEEKNLLGVLKGNYERIIISGGDGTLNYVANVLLKNGFKTPIGIIPAGTCNDFARSLGIPASLNDSLDIVMSDKILEIDAGLIKGEKYFLNTCAGGIFVNISFNTHNELKKSFGPFAYYFNVINEVANIKAFPIELETDDEVINEEVLLFLITNGKNAAGFSNINKEANLSDGMMDILLVKNCSPNELAALFLKVLSSDFLNDKRIAKFQTKNCTISSNKNVGISVDGEKFSGLPINIKFVHKALKVFVG